MQLNPVFFLNRFKMIVLISSVTITECYFKLLVKLYTICFFFVCRKQFVEVILLEWTRRMNKKEDGAINREFSHIFEGFSYHFIARGLLQANDLVNLFYSMNLEQCDWRTWNQIGSVLQKVWNIIGMRPFTH